MIVLFKTIDQVNTLLRQKKHIATVLVFFTAFHKMAIAV
jgi:hypothetical protein